MSVIQKGNSITGFPEDFTVIDIETTGFSPYKNEIIEISALKIQNSKIIEEFTTLVKPEGRINYYITKLTGITNEMVGSAPEIQEILPEFHNFIENSLLLGHNVNFDINFLCNNLQKHCNLCLTNDFIDLLRISRSTLCHLPNQKLITIANYFNLDTKSMHRGLKDCHITFECYLKIKDLNPKLVESI